MQPLAPSDPRQAGEFRLSARLGLGGMGQVFLGHSPGGRAVAVKICHPELAADPLFVERFAREVTAAQAVNGLYTAQVVAAGPYDRPPWMATAYVPGPSLSDYVQAYGPLPESAAWRLAGGIAEALLAVHARGLVHRDLKPSNVLLATDGPRVIDFGIASALETAGLTEAGSVMGSPPYMSPEQATGQPAGPASDVFALGSTLVFAASGAPPFGDDDAPALLFRVAHMEPALDGVPERLRSLVAACLDKDPAARPTLPQLLRTCQDAVSGRSSAASFWPPQMTAAIARHESVAASTTPPAGSGQSGGTASSSAQGLSGGQGDSHPATVTASSPTSGQAGVIGRRRLLAGVGGLAVAAGAAVAGYELAGKGGSPAVAKPTATGTGKQRAGRASVAWTFKADGPVRSGPAVSTDGQTVFFGSDNGTVYQLDAASGHLTKTFPVGAAVTGVTIADDTLLVGSADGKVHAFSTGNLGANWTFTGTGAPITGAPSRNGPGSDVICAASADGYVYAPNVNNGHQEWRTLLGKGPVLSQVVNSPPGTEVWAGCQDGTVYVLDTMSGTVSNKYATGGAISSAPLVVSASGEGYVGTSKGTLYDFSPADTGASMDVQWTFDARGPIAGTPALAVSNNGFDSTVFTATTSGTVYEVEPAPGNLASVGSMLWRYQVGGAVQTGPAFDSDSLTLYVGCDDTYLYAIDASTAKLLWKYKTGGAIRTGIMPKSSAAGTLVYFGSLDHQVYALHG